MLNQLPAEDAVAWQAHHWLSPAWNIKSTRHATIYGRYQALRMLIDFCAAFCFVAGSILFFSADTSRIATVLFLVGSVCFAVKPTIDVVRAVHLRKL